MDRNIERAESYDKSLPFYPPIWLVVAVCLVSPALASIGVNRVQATGNSECPTPASEVAIEGTADLMEHFGGFTTSASLTVSITPALPKHSSVRLVSAPVSGQSEREAVTGQDFNMPARVLLPAGESDVSITVSSTGPDHTTDGDAATEINLAYPLDDGCPSYRIAATSSAVSVTDNSLAIPEDCSTAAGVTFGGFGYNMAEGETVRYSVNLAGPTPTEFPIIIQWKIVNPNGYNVELHPDGDSDGTELIYTADDWAVARQSRTLLSLTITDPDDEVDANGKVMVAHHLLTADSNYSSEYCLQGLKALKTTQKLFLVSDVPTMRQQSMPTTTTTTSTTTTTTTTPTTVPDPEPDPEPDLQPDPDPEPEPERTRPPTRPRTVPRTDQDSSSVEEATVQFDDVSEDAWYYHYLQHIHAAGITVGCARDPLRYCPDRLVTRAQMALFLYRALDFSNAPAQARTFEDVDADHYAEEAIGAIHAAGITVGCARDPLRYCPDRPVTRAQMAAFLSRALTRTES